MAMIYRARRTAYEENHENDKNIRKARKGFLIKFQGVEYNSSANLYY